MAGWPTHHRQKREVWFSGVKSIGCNGVAGILGGEGMTWLNAGLEDDSKEDFYNSLVQLELKVRNG